MDGRWRRAGLAIRAPDVHNQWDAIVFAGSHQAQGTMAFGVDQQFPDLTRLTVEESHAIHAYVIQQSCESLRRPTHAESIDKEQPVDQDFFVPRTRRERRNLSRGAPDERLHVWN